ncbi:hypothetical protein [Xanthomonas rydalmerensis]|uniref:Uncharacterized protein n=1 Tax=Xanthomonas rydalmerensis TaxID=3046274 RepID=A0ABZ0JP74_9XANT|nr:hypothetical protein [Xanthomonas sp. DM-2023]WOS41158.1 hypothetical protein QN243_01345 [Xanthomonas sp. DM-2023]WOS45343.1 hypothetical protein QN242_01345 [Xanthomonas sp. DM-2023]WOS49522.1 hypothetical protein QN240_01345 [Xanthomonas sp. DM-2023]WOS53702.1 hypothetical protein QN244_01345 [Xanthomonas sp. DM-2023]WOS57885.1 hypothetical protein QN245_01345 [Xanthomonas sp. DM-2023]
MTQHAHNILSPDDPIATIEVTVYVYRVTDRDAPQPHGNTASGQYIVLLDKDVVHVEAAGVSTDIVYRLSPDTVARGIAFTGAFASDPRFQLSGPYLRSSATGSADPAHDVLSYQHCNTHASLISLSLQFSDTQQPDRRVAYDPQVTNSPGDNG